VHYFKREIGDYYKKAGRLGMLEHGACTLLTDACYDREQFPTMQEAIDWTWASTDSEIEAVKFVLARLFTLEDGLYINEAIQKELDKYHANAKTNKRIAIAREEKKRENKTKGVTNSTKRAPSVNGSSDNQHESAPNHKPLTTNQEPLTNKKNNTLSSSVEEVLQGYNSVIDNNKPNWIKCQVLNTKRTALIKNALKLVKPRADQYSETPVKYLVRLLEAMATDAGWFSGKPTQRSPEGYRCAFETNFKQDRLAQAIDVFTAKAES
jgi:uncharacterized protein YdaU (DUF1376 family)